VFFVNKGLSMALINCPECNTQVSDTAFKCTQCGFKLRKPKRGIFGKLFKWLFILFNILMAIWVFSAFFSVGEVIDTANNGAEQAGAAIGGTLAMGMLLSIWVIGDIILGLMVLFTKAKG